MKAIEYVAIYNKDIDAGVPIDDALDHVITDMIKEIPKIAAQRKATKIEAIKAIVLELEKKFAAVLIKLNFDPCQKVLFKQELFKLQPGYKPLFNPELNQNIQASPFNMLDSPLDILKAANAFTLGVLMGK